MKDILPKISTDSFEVSVTADVPFTINHGLGRQVEGEVIIARSAPCEVHRQDWTADTRQALTLIPTNTCFLRIVLL